MQHPPEKHGGFLRWLRAVTFITAMYALLLVMGLICIIPSKLSRKWSMVCIHGYCRWTLWLLRVIVGTRVVVRGTPPTGPCIVASKHQAFLDILILTLNLPQPAFVMKKSVRWIPILGVYAERLGSIAIDRSAGKDAMQRILDGAEQQAAGRQIIIFPQGTRLPPGKDAPFRPGVLRLYQQLQQPIVLTALNTGWFWPRTGTRRTPGTVTVSFIGEIEPGRELTIQEISSPIERVSDMLAAEAAAELADDPSMQS